MAQLSKEGTALPRRVGLHIRGWGRGMSGQCGCSPGTGVGVSSGGPLPKQLVAGMPVSGQHTNGRAVLREVMRGLSRGHVEEGEGMGREEGEGVGRRPLLTSVSWVEESKRIPMPSLEASPPRTEPVWPLSWVYHTACGAQFLNSPVGHWNPVLTT